MSDKPKPPTIANDGYVNKGGWNAPVSQVATRPPAPPASSAKPSGGKSSGLNK